MFTTNNIADTAAEPAHEATENTEEYEDPASNDEDKGEPVEPPVTSILVRVVGGVVLPLVKGEDKLGAGDQAQGGGREGQDVIQCEAGKLTSFTGQPAPFLSVSVAPSTGLQIKITRL